jgi:hypothetical protein
VTGQRLPAAVIAAVRRSILSDPRVETEYQRFLPVVRKQSAASLSALLVCVSDELDRRDRIEEEYRVAEEA